MKKLLSVCLLVGVSLAVAGCGHRQVTEEKAQPVATPSVVLVPDESHARVTLINVGGEGSNPVFYFMGSADNADQFLPSAGERVYDTGYLKKIPRYLIKMAGGTDVIDRLVGVDKPLKVRAQVQQQKFHVAGIAFGGNAQPAAQTFTPQKLKSYLVETVIADDFSMHIYEVSPSGEKTLIKAQ